MIFTILKLIIVPQEELHREGKSNDNFSQDLRSDILEIFQANKFGQLPQIFSHSYQIGSQQIYQNDCISNHNYQPSDKLLEQVK